MAMPPRLWPEPADVQFNARLFQSVGTGCCPNPASLTRGLNDGEAKAVISLPLLGLGVFMTDGVAVGPRRTFDSRAVQGSNEIKLVAPGTVLPWSSTILAEECDIAAHRSSKCPTL